MAGTLVSTSKCSGCWSRMYCATAQPSTNWLCPPSTQESNLQWTQGNSTRWNTASEFYGMQSWGWCGTGMPNGRRSKQRTTRGHPLIQLINLMCKSSVLAGHALLASMACQHFNLASHRRVNTPGTLQVLFYFKKATYTVGHQSINEINQSKSIALRLTCLIDW